MAVSKKSAVKKTAAKKAAVKKAPAKKATVKKAAVKKAPAKKTAVKTAPVKKVAAKKAVVKKAATKKASVKTAPATKQTEAAQQPSLFDTLFVTDEVAPAKTKAKAKTDAAAEAATLAADEVAEDQADAEEPAFQPLDPANQQRLQKILAQAGIASRRRAEEMIVAGQVMVNGVVITELGSKADPTRDHIRVEGKLLHGPERLRYYVLNKPRGFVTTVSDPEGRPTVMQFFDRSNERLYPVGRLDYLSEGLLIVTNDGQLANKLTRAASGVEKTYLVKVAGDPTEEEIEQLRAGVMIDRGRVVPNKPRTKTDRVRTSPAYIEKVREGDNPWFEVVLIEGRNRELRKMFEEVGHHVEKIRRVGYGPLVLDVEPGRVRELTADEIDALQKTAAGTLKPKRRKVGALITKKPARTDRAFTARLMQGTATPLRSTAPRTHTLSALPTRPAPTESGTVRPASDRPGSDRPSSNRTRTDFNRPGFNRPRPSGSDRTPSARTSDARPARFAKPTEEGYRPAKFAFNKPASEKRGAPAPTWKKPAFNRDRRDAASERPAFNKPAYSKPGFSKPTGDRPTFNKPAFGKPSFDRPRTDRATSQGSFDKPAYSKPAFDKPRFDKSGFDRSSSKPAFDRPSPDRSSPDRSSPDRPAGRKPFGDKPSFDRKPAGSSFGGNDAKPRFDRPKFGKSGFDKPKPGFDRKPKTFDDFDDEPIRPRVKLHIEEVKDVAPNRSPRPAARPFSPRPSSGSPSNAGPRPFTPRSDAPRTGTTGTGAPSRNSGPRRESGGEVRREGGFQGSRGEAPARSGWKPRPSFGGKPAGRPGGRPDSRPDARSGSRPSRPGGFSKPGSFSKSSGGFKKGPPSGGKRRG